VEEKKNRKGGETKEKRWKMKEKGNREGKKFEVIFINMLVYFHSNLYKIGCDLNQQAF